jgi:hypothetical protein
VYRQWKENILALLGIEGLMPVIDGTCQKPPQGHKLRFIWDIINMRAGQVLLTTVSDTINQDLARHFHRPRHVWKQLNSQYSVSELHIMRDGYEAAIRTGISQCASVADYVHRIESAWTDINTGHQWSKESERHKCWFLLIGLDSPSWKDWKTEFLADAERKRKQKPFCFRKMARELQLAEEKKPSTAKVFTTNAVGGAQKTPVECSHCGREAHTIDRCWKKHPHLAPKHPRVSGRNQGWNRNRGADTGRNSKPKDQTNKTEATGPAISLVTETANDHHGQHAHADSRYATLDPRHSVRRTYGVFA